MISLAQTNPWSGIDVVEHLFLFSPLIALVCTMLAVVTCPIILGRSAKTITAVVCVGLVATFVLTLRVASAVADGGMSGLSTSATAGILIADNLSVGFQIILLVFLSGVIWLWWLGSAQRERNAPEFFVLLLGSALGMVLMVSTTNLLMIVLAIEMASLPSYAIVGFDKRDRAGAEAALKYMIFGAVSAAIMLYGASLLYGLTATLSVPELAWYTARQFGGAGNTAILSVGLLCFFVGIAFKISAVPFHFWCPDAFQGAKIEVTTWLSVASKAAGLLLLGRLVLVFCAAVDFDVSMTTIRSLAWAIGIVAAVTCTFGNFSAYKQRSVKRLLAYSSIAHAGYMMMAAAVFIHPSVEGHAAGLTALFVYIIIYLFMNLGAFGVTALVSWNTGSDDIESFTGLMRRAPALAVPMVICLVSLVGIPPMAGFLGKWWILVALGSMRTTLTGEGWMSFGTLGYALIVVMVLNTLISLYYYMRIVVQMTMRDDGRENVRAPFGGTVLVNICALVLLVLFFMAQPLKTTAEGFSRNVLTMSASAAVKHETVAARELDTR